jgi:hypothetical protein
MYIYSRRRGEGAVHLQKEGAGAVLSHEQGWVERRTFTEGGGVRALYICTRRYREDIVHLQKEVGRGCCTVHISEEW